MSEGTHSAQRINGALTGDPYLMRVDTAQMQAPLRQLAGEVEERSAYDLRGTTYPDPDEQPGMEWVGLALMCASAAFVVSALQWAFTFFIKS